MNEGLSLASLATWFALKNSYNVSLGTCLKLNSDLGTAAVR